MNVAIIGAGLIGAKRAEALDSEDNLIWLYDIEEKRVKDLARRFNAQVAGNITQILDDLTVDIAVVSVINKYAVNLSKELLLSGKKCFCVKKPLGRNANESIAILTSAKKSGKIVKTGFNHRFYPSIIKAKELIKKNSIGEIINIRARYGHGGRLGMEKEWRCSKELCGGGGNSLIRVFISLI